MRRVRWPRPAEPEAGDRELPGGPGTAPQPLVTQPSLAQPVVAQPSAPGAEEPGPAEPRTGEPGWRGARRLLRGPLRLLVTGQALGQAGDGLAQISFAQLVVFD